MKKLFQKTILALALTGLSALVGTPAFAANTTYTVNATGNGSTGSGTTGTLRYCIEQANAASTTGSGHTINVDASLTGQTITLSSLIEVSRSMTINGNSVKMTGTTGNIYGLIWVKNPSSGTSTVTINRIWFDHCTAMGWGGALSNAAASLTINSCIFSHCRVTATDTFGRGAVIYNTGGLSVKGCTFYYNRLSLSTNENAPIATSGSSASLTLTGNLFYNPSAIATVFKENGGTATSGGYNVYDNPSSGFTFNGTDDEQIITMDLNITSLEPTDAAYNTISTAPTNFPDVYFNGEPRTYPYATAGALKMTTQTPPSITVSNTNESGAGSFRQAVADITDGGIITFDPSLTGETITLTSQIQINKDVIVNGNGIIISTGGTLLVNSGTISVVDRKTVILNRLRFSNCLVSNNGGALYCHTGTTVTLNSCIFDGNQAKLSGGGIYSYTTSCWLNVFGCTFYNNLANNGGAIYSSNLSLKGNVFFGNTVTSGVKTVYMNGKVVNSAYNVYDDNSGTNAYAFNDTGDTKVTTIGFNTTTFEPTGTTYNILSAALSGFPTFDFYGTTRTYPSGKAGAVIAAAPPKEITVTNTENTGEGSFRQAVTDIRSGGTITFDNSLTGKTLKLASQILINKNVTIEGNGVIISTGGSSGGSNGGALSTGNSSTVTINRVRFSECAAKDYGGALYCNGSTVRLNSCIFDGNKTTTSSSLRGGGGAIYNNISMLYASGCTFYNNSAGLSGGGAICNNSGSLILRGNVFFENTATREANIIYRGTTVTSSYNVYDNNTLANDYNFTGASSTNNKKITKIGFNPVTFEPTGTAYNIMPLESGFPTVDFNGKTRTYPNSTAGAITISANFATGGNTYITLEAAVAEVTKGGTITMLQDVELNKRAYLEENKTYTIDLDKYTLSGDLDELIRIHSGNVTISNGNISNSGYFGIIIDEDAVVVLDGLTVSAQEDAVDNFGTLSILSGNYTGEEDAIYCNEGGTVTITAGHFVATVDAWGDGCLLEEDGGKIVLAEGSTADVEDWLNSAMDVTVASVNGIGNTSATPAQIIGYYSILGQKLPKAPESGMYMIRYDNGKSEKIIK